MGAGRVVLAVCLLAVIPACGGSGGGAGSSSTPLFWNTQGGTGATTGTGEGGNLWNDPNSGIGAAPPPNDPTDIRTYTAPDIYILGNHHPLMTEVDSRNFPFVLLEEDTLTQLLTTWRYNEYVRIIGNPLPANARLVESSALRQNARAHAKHYAVWHPNIPLPLVNAEGDSVYYSAPVPGPGIELLPDFSSVIGPVSGRLPKSMITVDLVGQLVLSGPQWNDANVVAAYLIKTYPDFLRGKDWNSIGVGYWNNGGSDQHYYWNVILAKNPRPIITNPGIPPVINPFP
jgi:hypothetical protein